ncbi:MULTISPECIES: alpha/beta hydrolase [Streptomyces]|uniref:alpha/beta hydrolase n=1 Tax=Streptomyces TaxID=1883 RepID=UPI001C2E3FFC|nr:MULTISPECIES: alpha/beta hydrolase [Streptomyces]MBV1949237.1 alpha/beta hydrolase [Streptomyces sp. BV129]BDH05592.1 protease [Streptomyces seoulensis]
MPAEVKQSRRSAVRRGAGAGVLALALLGASLPAAVAAAPRSGRVDPADRPGMARFYEQKITWGTCAGPDMPKDLQCGKVTVPLDYAHPGTGTLDLALARYRTTGSSHRAVLLNFGGPGASGVSQLAAGGKEFMDLTNGSDVVAFDPRGVGRSAPVSCGAGEEPPSDSAGSDVSVDIGRPQQLMTLLRQSAELCAKYSGPVLKHIGTVNAARDMDVIRQALGQKKLDYLGFSYGTRLGAVYAAQFPGKVGRMALDGVDTLTEPLSEQGVAGAQGQQTALEGFLDWCVTDVGCPFGQDRRAADEQVLQLVRSLDENPVPTDFGGTFSGQDLVGAIGQGLYSKEMWPSLERALAALVEDGDARRVLSFSTGGYGLPMRAEGSGGKGTGLTDPQAVPIDNLTAALMAINCADDPDRPSAARVTRDLTDLRAAYEAASPVFGRYRLTQLLMCYGRPKGTDYIRDAVKNVPSARILLVGTRGDPATPYRWTEETARRLGSSAVVLDNKGDGHTGYTSSKCVHRKVDDFLMYGSLPPDRSSCPADGKAWSSTVSGDS